MEISLKGRTALVCGASQGIGLAIAGELAVLGATCILTARHAEKLKIAVAGLSTAGGQEHTFRPADFSQPETVREMGGALARETTVDILINNSGGPKGGPMLGAGATALEESFRQHVVCNQYLVQALLPGMKARGYGRIINIISTSVKTPLANLGVSNTIRLAVAAWSKTLANEMAGAPVTVNNVLPGLTDTDRLKSLIALTAKTEGSTEAQIEKKMKDSVPLRRFAGAEEVAAVVAFLASPAASYVHGTNIAVDGGRTPAL